MADNSLNQFNLATSEIERLNWLHNTYTKGLVVDRNWLNKHGFHKKKRTELLECGFLKEIAPKIYCRPSSNGKLEISWEHVVYSLQNLMELPVHVGGLTALEMQGVIHYGRMRGPMPIYLYTFGRPIPDWLNSFPSDGKFYKKNGTKLFEQNSSGIIQFNREFLECEVRMSVRERAMCEYLDCLPGETTFHMADMYMDSTSFFSPNKVKNALEECKSIKVKRLYLFYAERNKLGWFKKLRTGSIDLGRGKRQIAVGGVYDSKYMITVEGDLDLQAGCDWRNLEGPYI